MNRLLPYLGFTFGLWFAPATMEASASIEVDPPLSSPSDASSIPGGDPTVRIEKGEVPRFSGGVLHDPAPSFDERRRLRLESSGRTRFSTNGWAPRDLAFSSVGQVDFGRGWSGGFRLERDAGESALLDGFSGGLRWRSPSSWVRILLGGLQGSTGAGLAFDSRGPAWSSGGENPPSFDLDLRSESPFLGSAVTLELPRFRFRAFGGVRFCDASVVHDAEGGPRVSSFEENPGARTEERDVARENRLAFGAVTGEAEFGSESLRVGGAGAWLRPDPPLLATGAASDWGRIAAHARGEAGPLSLFLAGAVQIDRRIPAFAAVLRGAFRSLAEGEVRWFDAGWNPWATGGARCFGSGEEASAWFSLRIPSEVGPRFRLSAEQAIRPSAPASNFLTRVEGEAVGKLGALGVELGGRMERNGDSLVVAARLALGLTAGLFRIEESFRLQACAPFELAEHAGSAVRIEVRLRHPRIVPAVSLERLLPAPGESLTAGARVGASTLLLSADRPATVLRFSLTLLPGGPAPVDLSGFVLLRGDRVEGGVGLRSRMDVL